MKVITRDGEENVTPKLEKNEKHIYEKNTFKNKLVYTVNSVYKGHTEGGETLSGYFYSYSAMRAYAKKRGFSGVKKADSTFMNLLWARINELDGINATRRD